MFNNALKKIVEATCIHGTGCPMWGTIDIQTNISIGVMIFIILIGFYLVFLADEIKIPWLKPRHKTLHKTRSDKDLDEDEKKVINCVVESEGTIFQSDLVEKTKFSKVKITRVLDRLEGKGFIERRRRGMTNVVILK